MRKKIIDDEQEMQFQESDTNYKILGEIKKADSSAVVDLLSSFLFNEKVQEKLFVITDLGCGEGRMLLKVLEKLHKQKCLPSKLSIYACDLDVNGKLLEKYRKNFTQQKPAYLNIEHLNIKKEAIEKYDIKKSDLILASHSFYYIRKIWDSSTNTKLTYQEHILTKLLGSLKKTGCLCVTLQSTKSSNIKSKYKSLNGNIVNHNSYENFLYPLLGKAEKNRTNAESFEKSLIQYRENFRKRHRKTGKTDLFFKDKRSMAIIQLGEFNFDKTDTSTGKYLQSDEVNLKLKFYTRNKLDDFDAEKQKKLLRFIHDNCTKRNGKASMCHVNRSFFVRPTKKQDEVFSNTQEKNKNIKKPFKKCGVEEEKSKSPSDPRQERNSNLMFSNGRKQIEGIDVKPDDHITSEKKIHN